MARLVRGCLGRLVVLALLAVLVGVGWYNRHELASWWDRLRGHTVEVSPEIAARADEKLAALNDGAAGDRVALDESEIQSLIEYRWGGFLPADVTSPRVQLKDGRVTLEANVSTARFGPVTELKDIAAFLPDTASLRAVASFVPLDRDHVALEVHELGAANIPLPKRLIPSILRRFRGSGLPGLPPNAVAVPLPPGVSNVYVSGDSLVFVGNRARGD